MYVSVVFSAKTIHGQTKTIVEYATLDATLAKETGLVRGDLNAAAVIPVPKTCPYYRADSDLELLN
jgi:hypothetical protein